MIVYFKILRLIFIIQSLNCLINEVYTKTKQPQKSLSVKGTIKIIGDEPNAKVDKYTFNNSELKHETEIKKALEDKFSFVNDKKMRFQIVNNFSEPETRDSNKSDWAVNAYSSRRIVGGMETSISVYPFMVAIIRDGKQWCGGSVLDEQWILSSAHCVADVLDNVRGKLRRFLVRAGSSFYNKDGYVAMMNRVFIADEGFYRRYYDRDWSLVRLDRPLPLGRTIAVINLPALGFSVQQGDLMIVMGWGSTRKLGDQNVPERLHFAPVAAMSNAVCQMYFSAWWTLALTERLLCAGWAAGGRDSCDQDKGGPLVHKGIQVGISSYNAKNCGDPKYPGVYARTEHMSWWAQNLIANNEAYSDWELRYMIDQMRKREKEMEKLTKKVDETKNGIKTWFRTLTSGSFVDLAREKLKEAGIVINIHTRRSSTVNITMDDATIDEINLHNLIHDKVIANETDESDVLLSTLALHEVIKSKRASELFPSAGIEKINIEDILVTR